MQAADQVAANIWPARRRELSMAAKPRNPDGVRLLAWNGLEYTGSEAPPSSGMFAETIDELRKRQEAGDLPADLDPACLVVMLMAMAMAPTTLPQIIEGTCGADPRSPEFLDRFAGQVAVLARHLGLG
ncbi:hypothetical protein [Phytohabitans aurantiacus]|nr:hypothetical protein [Phytohabitans aurantiacus]